LGSKLRVELGDPVHGWMDLTIRSTVGLVTLAVSHVLYDTLNDLVEALHALAIGDDHRSVRVMEEPEVCELRFERENGTVRLKICRRPSSHRCQTLLEAEGSFQEVCLPFWRALRKLQVRFPEKEFELRWKRPFPALGMEKLSADLRRMRGR